LSIFNFLEDVKCSIVETTKDINIDVSDTWSKLAWNGLSMKELIAIQLLTTDSLKKFNLIKLFLIKF